MIIKNNRIDWKNNEFKKLLLFPCLVLRLALLISVHVTPACLLVLVVKVNCSRYCLRCTSCTCTNTPQLDAISVPCNNILKESS
jgi:hypothetical protein